jgi:hypothetical protein
MQRKKEERASCHVVARPLSLSTSSWRSQPSRGLWLSIRALFSRNWYSAGVARAMLLPPGEAKTTLG